MLSLSFYGGTAPDDPTRSEEALAFPYRAFILGGMGYTFEFRGEIGRGGFCLVQECTVVEDGARTGRTVAVKTLLDGADEEPEILARFQREARLMDDVLNHPNIVRVLGRNLSAARPYFVMEKADCNLADEIERGRWTEQLSNVVDDGH